MVALMSKKKTAFLTLSAVLLLTLVGGVLYGQITQRNNVFRYLSIFTEVFDLVRNNYVEQVSSDQLLDGAFSGVTDAIDEFSYYVSPTQMAAYRAFSDVEDNGLGVAGAVVTTISIEELVFARRQPDEFFERVGHGLQTVGQVAEL